MTAAPSLGHRVVGAAQWRFAASVTQGVLQFGIGVLLARLLPPADFGLVALAWVTIAFVNLVSDFGLGRAVIQRRPLTEAHVRVAFTGSVLLGAALTAVVAMAAPVLAGLARTPPLAEILRIQALLFIVAGIGVTGRALLQRELRFRALFAVDTAGYVVGYAGVAVTLAVLGAGVWALVAGSLTQSLVTALGALWATRHPMRPLWARLELGQLLGFGVGASLGGLVNYVARQGDKFIVGRWLGAATLGHYARAYHVMELPLLQVSAVLSSVLFPAFAAVQSDRERMGRAYLLGVQTTVLLAAPVMVGMFIAAPHLVVGLYGPNWEATILPLQILCAVGTFRAVYHLGGAVAQGTGRVYAEAGRQVGYAGLVVVGALVGRSWGLVGVAVGVAVAITYMYVAMAQLSLQITGQRWRAYARAHVPGLMVAGWVGLFAGMARMLLDDTDVASSVALVVLIAVCAMAATVGIYLLPPAARPVELFERFAGRLVRLPMPVRGALTRMLRVPV